MDDVFPTTTRQWRQSEKANTLHSECKRPRLISEHRSVAYNESNHKLPGNQTTPISHPKKKKNTARVVLEHGKRWEQQLSNYKQRHGSAARSDSWIERVEGAVLVLPRQSCLGPPGGRPCQARSCPCRSPPAPPAAAARRRRRPPRLPLRPPTPTPPTTSPPEQWRWRWRSLLGNFASLLALGT